ncbi:MAG: aspartate kinase [Chlamydiia bacterium]|nr:aspartate kinase [Chlamydiia bacterium]
MTTYVLKFGGAALANIEQIERVADITAAHAAESEYLIVVVSAMGDMTDQLLSMAHSVHPDPPKREQDMLISVGERISMTLLAMALHKRSVKAISLTGSQSGVITCTRHGEADILEVRPIRVQKHLDEGNVVIVAGFQGVSADKEITTLGRGGSDTSAVALGVALNAKEIIFYKDVLGIYDADPETSPEAKLLSHLTYAQALPLCDSGGVIAPRAIRLAEKHSMPLRVRSFVEPGSGTCVS